MFSSVVRFVTEFVSESEWTIQVMTVNIGRSLSIVFLHVFNKFYLYAYGQTNVGIHRKVQFPRSSRISSIERDTAFKELSCPDIAPSFTSALIV